MGRIPAIQLVYPGGREGSSMVLPLRLSNCSASMFTKQPHYNGASYVCFPTGKGHAAWWPLDPLYNCASVNEHKGTFQFKYHVLSSLVKVNQVVPRAQILPRWTYWGHQIEDRTWECIDAPEANWYSVKCSWGVQPAFCGNNPLFHCHLLQTEMRWWWEAKNGNEVGVRDRNSMEHYIKN